MLFSFNLTSARARALLGLCAALLLAPPLQGAKADPMAYEVTNNELFGPGPNLFGTVDLATGVFKQTSALSFLPSGLGEVGSKLYTSTFTGTAFGQINPATGAVTAISNSGLDGGEYLALGSTLNTLYALDGSFNLYSVDPATGAATLIGSTGLSPDNPAYQLSTGSSVLYFSNANQLYSLNTLTGAATLIGPDLLSGDGFDGLVFENGILYGGYSPASIVPGSIYTIDTASGAATFIAMQDSSIGIVYGFAPSVPEPSTFAMFALALFAFAVFQPGLLPSLNSGRVRSWRYASRFVG
jgi:hypothetical protein